MADVPPPYAAAAAAPAPAAAAPAAAHASAGANPAFWRVLVFRYYHGRTRPLPKAATELVTTNSFGTECHGAWNPMSDPLFIDGFDKVFQTYEAALRELEEQKRQHRTRTGVQNLPFYGIIQACEFNS
jgi:hypothetical protein